MSDQLIEHTRYAYIPDCASRSKLSADSPIAYPEAAQRLPRSRTLSLASGSPSKNIRMARSGTALSVPSSMPTSVKHSTHRRERAARTVVSVRRDVRDFVTSWFESQVAERGGEEISFWSRRGAGETKPRGCVPWVTRLSLTSAYTLGVAR